MKGIIFLWFGSIVSIPPGWALCDGTQGTPNLAGLFIPCAGSSYNPGDTNPLGTHQHPFTGDGHGHTISEDARIDPGTDYAAQTSEDPAIGTTNYYWPRPPHHVLAYIMKLP